MAYYVIKYEDSLFANMSFVRDALELSERELINKLASQQLKSTEFLGNILVSFEHIEKEDMDIWQPENQDISKRMKLLVASKDCKRHFIKKDAELMTLGGIHFVRMEDIVYPNKYNKRDKIAHIKLCGSIYVALDRAIAGKENTSIVFTTK